MKLNHCASRVPKGKLELIIEFFTLELGFKELRRIPTDVWLRQADSSVDLQFCESESETVSGDKQNWFS